MPDPRTPKIPLVDAEHLARRYVRIADTWAVGHVFAALLTELARLRAELATVPSREEGPC